MAFLDETPIVTDADKLQLHDWLRLSPDERRVAIDLVREIAKDGRLDALKRLLNDEPKISSLLRVREGLATIGAAILKAAALITAGGVIAVAWRDLIGKG